MELANKALRRFVIAVMWLGLCSSYAWGAGEVSVDTLLAQFERQENAETANRVMDTLYREEFLDEPLRFTARMPLDTMRQQVYYWCGEWLYSRHRYDEARRVALKALPLFHRSNDARADCLNLLAITSVRLGDFSNAANYARQCLEMDMKSGDDDRISSSMNTVAGIYMAANQARDAEKYILGAIEHSGRVDNPPRRAVILGMASEIYHKLGDDAKALSYAEEAYGIEMQLNREPQASIRLSQKGSALIGLQRYEEAEQVLGKALPRLKNSNDMHSYAIALNNMGTAVLRQDRPGEAVGYYREAAGIFSRMSDLYNEIHSHRGLYESYWEINPDSAKIALGRFNMLKDSLYSHSTAESLSRYNAEFGNDMLQKENREMRRKQKFALAGVVLLLLAVVAAAWLIIRSTRKRYQRRMQKLMGEIERLRARSEETPKTEEPSPESPAPAVAEEGSADTENQEFLKSVVDAVNAAMATGRVSVEEIASGFHMGVQSFRRRLQGAAGETPKAFFTAIRMERAASLLAENPDIPISKVAEMCAFENASSFTHAFKRMHDISPSRYREEHAGKSGETLPE